MISGESPQVPHTGDWMPLNLASASSQVVRKNVDNEQRLSVAPQPSRTESIARTSSKEAKTVEVGQDANVFEVVQNAPPSSSDVGLFYKCFVANCCSSQGEGQPTIVGHPPLFEQFSDQVTVASNKPTAMLL